VTEQSARTARVVDADQPIQSQRRGAVLDLVGGVVIRQAEAPVSRRKGSSCSRFGDRLGLAEALDRHMLDEPVNAASDLAVREDPWDALVAWLHAYVDKSTLNAPCSPRCTLRGHLVHRYHPGSVEGPGRGEARRAARPGHTLQDLPTQLEERMTEAEVVAAFTAWLQREGWTVSPGPTSG
jgi:hypothetical protein